MNLNNSSARKDSLKEKEGSKDYIKIDKKEPNYFVLVPNKKKEKGKIIFACEDGWSHFLKIGKGTSVPCEGSKSDKGWAPDSCRFCARALSHYVKGKEIRADGGKRAEADADIEKKLGNGVKSSHQYYLNAVKLEGEMEKFKGSDKREFGLSKEGNDSPKIQKIPLSAAQFTQLDEIITEEFNKDASRLYKVVLEIKKSIQKNSSGNTYGKYTLRTVGKLKSFPLVEGDLYDLSEEFELPEETVLEKLLIEYDAGLSEDASDDLEEENGDISELSKKELLSFMKENGIKITGARNLSIGILRKKILKEMD